MSKTVLVVDDKANVRTLVRDYLTEQGFHVSTADNGQNALYAARRDKPDLILLDIMMPDMDGYEFIRAYRKESETPIIMLTAKLEESDKVIGLELGADDYITKPFGMRELVARVNTVLRRAGKAPTPSKVLRAAEIVLDQETHSVTVKKRDVRLTPSEFDLLAILMASPGRVYSRIELLDELQGTSFEGIARTIDQHIRNLRAKIEPDPAEPTYIETVFGVGYRFAENNMSRSITLRLILAFLLVGITVVALASGITYLLTVREFKQLTFDQARDRFAAEMTFYYESHGGWEGVLNYYQLRSAVRSPFEMQMNGRQEPGGGPRQRLFFALAGVDGRVLIPAGDYGEGQLVGQATLSQGTAVTVNDQRVGSVLLVGSPPPLGPLEDRYLTRTNLALLYATLGASAVALVLGIVLARAVTRPIRALTTAIHAMAQGDLKQTVEVGSKDELGELAAAFNQMSAELDRLLQARRQMTADIAHDLRNPLTVIGGYMESIRDGVLKLTPERLDAIQSEVQHLERLVEDLRTLSQADAGELTLNREPVSVPALLEEAAKSYRPLAGKQRIDLRIDTEAGLPSMQADSDRLRRVLGNLISNSLRYTPAGGEITLAAHMQDAMHVRLEVIDNGKGIEPEALPYIFDRLYRADLARSQQDESGLGLAIARSIVEAHGGTISAESTVGAGTRITILLPM